jgi:hypothetical protein
MRRNKSLRKSRGKKRMRGGQNNNLYAPPSNSVITNGVVASNAANNAANNVGNVGNVGNSGISSNVSNVAQPTAEPENTSFFGNLFGFANKTKKQVKDTAQYVQDQATIARLKAEKNVQEATETATKTAKGFWPSLFGGSRRRYKHKKRHNKTKKSKRHGRKTHRKH